MIAQLHTSRPKGKKRLEKDGVQFGWKSIEEMFSREISRAKAGNRTRVPGLRPNYVYRDSWTRLNVRPAKIMQVSSHFLFCLYVVVNLNLTFP